MIISVKDSRNNFLLWLLGPTSSGKTTLAQAFTERMLNRNIPILHFDGDEIRDIFGTSLSFKKEDRMMVVKTLVHFSNKTVNSSINVVVSALTAHQCARDYIIENCHNLILGYVECSIDVCSQRDPKGIYKKAMNGEISTLIGVNTPYLPPKKIDFVVNTEHNDVKTSLNIIEKYLIKRGINYKL